MNEAQALPTFLSQAYQSACMDELTALKPGNVHIFADGHGLTVSDFILSAEVSAQAITQTGVTVGERIFNATQVTQRALATNTNLGIILLCAPLIHTALNRNHQLDFRQNLIDVLNSLTIEDAKLAAEAISMAKPAGLGLKDQHDVRSPITVTLLELMQVAQHEDRISWQYAHHFSDIFDLGLPYYRAAFAKFNNKAWAITALYLAFLKNRLDTHIIRKYGIELAEVVMREAQELALDYASTDNPKLMQQRLLAWDASLKARGINPGTGADFTVATVFLDKLL